MTIEEMKCLPGRLEIESDMVSVVRCKDCKYCGSYYGYFNTKEYICRYKYRCSGNYALKTCGVDTEENGYCSHGVKREGESK